MDIFEKDDNQKTLFADLLLPVPVPRLFTYRVPRALNEAIQPGVRAIVQFGDRKILTAIVAAVHENPPKDYEAKSILEVLDHVPAVTPVQFKVFQWIASYYACSVGEVLNAALPAGLKLSSESMVQLHPAFDLEETDLDFSEKERMVITHLRAEPMSYSDISKLLGVKYIYAILKSLAAKEAIILFEEVKEKYKPKVEKRIRLRDTYIQSRDLEALFEAIAAKPKQEEVLLKYLQEVPVLQDLATNKKGISRKALVSSGISESSLNTLVKNAIFEEFESIVPRFADEEVSPVEAVSLSTDQEQAQQAIMDSFNKNNVILLHGITGSGKTEIYINLIRKALDSGNQVLYLLPEIALTTQIVQRLRKVFGATMGVYHSRFSDNERVEVWNGVVTGKVKFVVGVRSSIFLPFDNLGLIIVDEEHDPSYKQHEPAPRYHARDVAVMMGQFHHAKVLLGSATPSVESFYNAKLERYGLVTLNKRFGNTALPSIVLADMRRERARKTVKGEFSSVMLHGIEETLSKKEQVIIFQNRRGYSPMVTCEDCGWVPKCVNCAVSLTYHQIRHALVCHYCGYRESLHNQCPTCTSARIQTVGYGTEKLEEELNVHFTDATIQRMDLDTTRSKTGYETIIDQFERGETNILVGTQMVTKGLDFSKVSLVGIFNADRMMHFPDFRSYERAFQLITQVSGRAGRREKTGTVIIQTSHPDHPVLMHILENRLADFYEKELRDRKEHGYPPFTRLIEIIVKHSDRKTVRDAALHLTDLLRNELTSVKTLGPEPPMIAKIRNQFLMRSLIKIPRGVSDLAGVKMNIRQIVEKFSREKKEYRSIRVIIDVDPV